MPGCKTGIRRSVLMGRTVRKANSDQERAIAEPQAWAGRAAVLWMPAHDPATAKMARAVARQPAEVVDKLPNSVAAFEQCCNRRVKDLRSGFRTLSKLIAEGSTNLTSDCKGAKDLDLFGNLG